ncbi:glycosyltransferase [candidate division WOR-3 bacterium]|nr:glycosyltransferase [candidate division WOR-3 bacterium]
MGTLNKKVVIVTHYLVYGAPQALREYLMAQKIKKLIFIAHPLQVDGTKSYREIVTEGKTKNRLESKVRTKIPILNYILETILSLFWTTKEKDRIDLWIGVDPLNASLGVVMKKFGRVRKVIYYTIDYVPGRFKNKFLNNIYHWLDKFCVKNADEVWNVSYRIAEGREKLRGLKRKFHKNQKVVPIGVWLDRIKRLPFDRIKKHQLLFIGHLIEKQGVQLVLEAVPEIINKIPDFHFLIVGGGEYQDILINKARSLKINKYVTFTGWIKDRKKLDEIMADSAVAIATYDKTKDTFTYYADPTKLKDYLSAGLPIILTDVPYNAKEIEENKCGIIVNYDKNQVASAIIELMEDENKLKEYRNNALNYAKQFDWNKIFKENLERVLS